MKKFILFFLALFSFVFVDVSAAKLDPQFFGYNIFGRSEHFTWHANANEVKNGTVTLVNIEMAKSYNYFIFDVCTTGAFILSVSNSGYNGYFNEKVVTYDTGLSCDSAGYTGRLYQVQLEIGKYQVLGDGMQASSYISIKNTVNWYNPCTLSNFYLSDEDVLTPLQKQSDINNSQKETNKKIDSVKDSIDSEDSDTTSKKCGVTCKLKGIFTGIIELPKKIVTLLIDGLKSLFIPSDTDFITNFVDSIESKLGFIAEIPVSIIEFALSLVTSTWTEVTTINFPSINIFGYYFWDAQTIDISEGINIFKPFKYVTDVICIVLCATTLNKWREKFTGGGS